MDTDGQRKRYRYMHDCEGCFTAASLSLSPGTGIAAQLCLLEYAPEMSLEEQSSSVFVTVCVHAKTRVCAQRKPVSS